MKSTKYLLALIVICPLVLNAQDSLRTKALKEVVIKVSRSEKLASDLPLTIGVVTKAQIEDFQPMTPVEAMQYQTGVVKQSDGGLASTPIIRGLSRERAPLLIDGNPFVGGRIRSYSLIDLYQIERIEIIKGPASAFWGSDAVGGLVNVVTRKAESGYDKDFKLGGSLYGGHQSMNAHTRARAEIEGRGSGLDFLIGGGTRKSSNIQTPEGEVENSQFETVNMDFNIGFSPSENSRIGVNGKYIKNSDVGFPGGLGAPGPPRIDRRFEPDIQQALNISYDAKNVSDRIAAIGARVFFKKQELHINQRTNVFFTGTQDVNREIDVELDVDVPFWGAKLFSSLRLGDKTKMTVGADFIQEHRIGTFRDLEVEIFNPLGVKVNEVLSPYQQIQPDSYYKGIGLFAINEVIFNDKFDMLLALRYDNVKTSIDDEPFIIPLIAGIYNEDNKESQDNAFTGSLGLKYNVLDDLNIVGNLANSFRATDLFSKYHFTAVGVGFLVPNPDLESEKGIFYEFGARFDNKVIYAEVNYFQNFVKNMFVLANIDFNGDATDGNESVQNQNIGEATITGVEMQLRVNINEIGHFYYLGSYIKGVNEVTGDPLSQIPAFHNLVGFQYRGNSNKFFAQLEARLVGEQNEVAPNEIETPSYTVINFNAGLNLHNLVDKFPYTKLVLGINNIGDEAYRSHVSRGAPGNQNVFLEPGRSFNISLLTRFGAAASR